MGGGGHCSEGGTWEGEGHCSEGGTWEGEGQCSEGRGVVKGVGRSGEM